jgi:hypothetical protein
MIKKLLATIGIGVVGVFLLWFGFKDLRETKALKASGKTASGEVTGIEERSGRRGKTKYYLTANFKTEDGKSVTAEHQVSSGLYSDAVHSKTVKVHYLPTDPAICRFGSELTADYKNVGFGVFMLGASVVSLVRRKSS